MSLDILLEEFEVRPIKPHVGIEIFSLGCPHPLGLRVYLPDRTHKFVSSPDPVQQSQMDKGPNPRFDQKYLTQKSK